MQQIEITKLFNWQYLITQPSTDMIYLWPSVIAMLSLIVMGIVLFFIRKRIIEPKSPTFQLLGLLANWIIYPSIIGLLLIFFRNQGITVISWRLWLVALVLVWVAGVIYFLYFLIFTYPHRRREINIQKIKSKYMPTSNKARR